MNNQTQSALDFLYAKEKDVLNQLEVVRSWIRVEELNITAPEPNETHPTFITMKEIDDHNSKMRESAPKYLDGNGIFVQVKDCVTFSKLGKTYSRLDKRGWLVAVSKDGELFYVNWWGQKTNKTYERKYIAKVI